MRATASAVARSISSSAASSWNRPGITTTRMARVAAMTVTGGLFTNVRQLQKLDGERGTRACTMRAALSPTAPVGSEHR